MRQSARIPLRPHSQHVLRQSRRLYIDVSSRGCHCTQLRTIVMLRVSRLTDCRIMSASGGFCHNPRNALVHAAGIFLRYPRWNLLIYLLESWIRV